MNGLHSLVSRHNRVLALALLPLLLAAIAAATVGAIADKAAAGSTSMFGGIGPGALGQVRFALARIGLGQFDLPQAVAQKALRGVPLASDPLTALAAADLMRNTKGTPHDAALLAEAIRRDPRSRAARILQLRMDAANGNLEGAFDQLAVLSRLNPALVGAIIDSITNRIATPRMVDQALGAIAGHDELYPAFVNRMTTKRKSPEVAMRLSQGLPMPVMRNPEIRAAVVQQLVATGQVNAARNLWQQGNRGGASGLVHSPDFTDTAARPPFNWVLSADTTGAAERIGGGGVSINYYDRNPGYLVRQLLTLTPGTYRALADFEMDANQRDNIHLRVTCAGTDKVLAEMPFVISKPGSNRLTMAFTVPASECTGQNLAVIGTASDERGETVISLRRLDIQAGGGQ